MTVKVKGRVMSWYIFRVKGEIVRVMMSSPMYLILMTRLTLVHGLTLRYLVHSLGHCKMMVMGGTGLTD